MWSVTYHHTSRCGQLPIGIICIVLVVWSVTKYSTCILVHVHIHVGVVSYTYYYWLCDTCMYMCIVLVVYGELPI